MFCPPLLNCFPPPLLLLQSHSNLPIHVAASAAGSIPIASAWFTLLRTQINDRGARVIAGIGATVVNVVVVAIAIVATISTATAASTATATAIAMTVAMAVLQNVTGTSGT